MKSILAIIFVILLSAPQFDAYGQRRERTTRRGLQRVAVTSQATTADADTIVPSAGMITLSGYDKPLKSSKESIFVTNRSRRTVSDIEVSLTYLDPQGRQLHERHITITIALPPGQTRQFYFPSWDKQRAFFYELSGKPRTSDGSPYKIKATPVRAIVPRGVAR